MSDGPRSQTRQSLSQTALGSTQLSRSPSPERPVATDEQIEIIEGDELIKENELRLFRTRIASITSEFRDSKLSRSRAIAQISTSIDTNPHLTSSEKETAIDLYCEELNSIHLNRAPRGFIAGPKEKKAIDNSVDDLLGQFPARGKRSHQSSDESDELDDVPRKRGKIKESELPPGWFDSSDSAVNSESSNCLETCKRLKVYNKDISGAKFLARMSRHAPAGIPSAQWDRILRGEVLDLDHFLSSLHRTTVNEEGETRIGNAKISLGVADAKRKISTAAEWSSAWQLASEAVAFAFPHRAQELNSYGSFIAAEFAAKVPSSHPRVILFDVAVRNIVQGGQCTLLTDRVLHMRFYSAILMPDGVVPNASASANRRSIQPRASGSKTDICNRFNTATGCPSSDSDCRYRHVCKKCKRGGHGKERCPN